MTRRIVIGAMARSGSTWVFNACRLLAVRAFGEENVYATDAKSYEPAKSEVEIIKIHEPDEQFCTNDGVITCVRDLRDSFCSGVAAGLMEISSYPRRGLTEGVLAGIDILFVHPSRFWRAKTEFIIRYEDMTVSKTEHLRMLSHIVVPDERWTDRELIDMAVALEILPVLYNDYIAEQSYLFGNGRHRQNIGVAGHIRHMPPSDSRKIAKRYEDWFEEFGYSTCGYSPAVGRVLHGPTGEGTT